MSDQIDLTIGFSQVEIEELLEINKAELKKMLSAHAHDNSSFTRKRQAEVYANIKNCQRALQKLDPVTYPPDTGNMIQAGFSGYMEK